MLTVLLSYPVPGLDSGSGEPLGSCALLQKVPMPEKIFSSRVYYLYLRLIFTLSASGWEVGGLSTLARTPVSLWTRWRVRSG